MRNKQKDGDATDESQGQETLKWRDVVFENLGSMISITPQEYKVLREKLGLTQAELAKRLGVSRKTVNARENGAKINEEAALAIRELVLAAKKTPPEDSRYERFGKEMWKMIRKIGGEFCGDEWSEDVLPLAQAAGLCCRVAYDPEIHGDAIEAEPGEEIWWWGG